MLIGGLRPNQLLIAALLVFAVSAIRQVAADIWNPGFCFTLFYPVLLVCTWFGGFALGVFATGLWVLSLLVFLHYTPTVQLGDSATILGVLVVEGLTVSYLLDHLRKKGMRLQEQQINRMRVFINEAPAAIAMFDTEMRYIAASSRWCSDYGIVQETIVGRSHYDVFPEIPERWREIHRRCLLGATERAEDDFFQRADGSLQWLRWEVKPWMSEDTPGRIGGILIFSEDITSIKVAHEKALTLAAQSEADTALRIEAEAMGRGKDEFLATLSHELRSPLHAMLGWMHVLRKTAHEPQRLPQALGAIETSVQTLSQLISDLLDVNRIISGKLRLNITPVPIEPFLNKAIAAALPQAIEKSVRLELRTQAADEETVIRGDAVRLQQCLSNLLSNAIKFTPNAGSVIVSTTKRGDSIQITVRDTGQGIRPEALPQIFDRYAQTPTASARVHGGLGLGLSIVKHLVGLHGGTISAESAGPGLGSSFTISLPIPVAKESQPGLTRLSEFVDKPNLLKDLTVLTVDDDLETRELLRVLLEDYGAHVKVASCVDDALGIARTSRLNLIISDLAMPQRDGCELIKELRSLKIGAPAIVLTGNGAPAEINRALQAGFNEHVLKPVGAEQLLDTIVRVLGPIPWQQAGNE